MAEEPEVKVPQQKGKVYLRLEAIYEADVQVELGKHVGSFLLHFKDLAEVEYICPLTCEENYKEDMRKRLGRLKPLHLSFSSPAIEKKTEGSPDITNIQDTDERVVLNS